jgi:hypothetical protein
MKTFIELTSASSHPLAPFTDQLRLAVVAYLARVITEPTNLYRQDMFPSRDETLSFHVGLALRMSYDHDRRIPPEIPAADLLRGTWRRWEQAFEPYESGDEAENFQAVGVRLRECLISFIIETAWTVPASVDSRLSCPIRRESEKWVRHAAHLRRSTSSSR